jgi:hypothetical protein
LSNDKSEDRELKKMKFIESLFLKKEKQDEHKRLLREKRELRRNLLSSASGVKIDGEID